MPLPLRVQSSKLKLELETDNRSEFEASASARRRPKATGDPPDAFRGSESILWHALIDLICPGSDPALEIPDPGVAGILERFVRLGASATHLAVQNNVLLLTYLRQPVLDLRERNETRTIFFKVGYLPLVRFPHINNRQLVSAIQPLLQIRNRDFPIIRGPCSDFLLSRVVE